MDRETKTIEKYIGKYYILHSIMTNVATAAEIVNKNL